MNFLFDLKDERSTFRPTNVMVYGDRRKTCIGGLNWGFTSCRIGDRGLLLWDIQPSKLH